MSTRPDIERLGVHSIPVGDLLFVAVNDGYVNSSAERLLGITVAEAERMMLAATGTNQFRTSVNTFVCRWASRTILFDTGSGMSDGPTCGRMLETLAAAGLRPQDIDAVLLTHIHPDHSHGLASASGEPNFPNADVYVHQSELDYWLDDARMAAADERARQRHFEAARFHFAPYRVSAFRFGEVLPGITAIPCPGHTPGHTSFRVNTASQDVLIWGDTVHRPEIQVPRPDVAHTADMDRAAAARSRRMIFDLAVRDDLLIAGMHLNFPGIGRLKTTPDGYSLESVFDASGPTSSDA